MQIFIVLLLSISTVWATTPYKQALDKKLNAYIKEGVISGGSIATPLTLLKVRRDYSSKANIERVILDMGDQNAQPLKNQLGFFHIAVEKDPARVVIDLNHVQRSALTAAQLAKVFSKSPVVKATALRFDPEDQSTTMILDMKKPVEVESFEMPSSTKASRIILDIKPLKK